MTGEKLMIVALLAVFLQASPEASKSIAEPQATAEQTPINVNGLVELSYNPDRAVHELWAGLAGSWETAFLLRATQDGKVVGCQSILLSIPENTASTLCEDIKANSTISFFEGYSLAGRHALIGFRKAPFTPIPGITAPRNDAGSPFAFALTDIEEREFLSFSPPLEGEVPLVAVEESADIQISADDLEYPSYALRAKQAGETKLLVGIAEDGKVQSCRPIESSGYAILDNVACKNVLRFASFDPDDIQSSDGEVIYQTIEFVWSLGKSVE